MNIIYDKVKDGVRICRCLGLDGRVEIPEAIGGMPVREIAPYAFAQVQRNVPSGEKFTVGVETGGSDGEGEPADFQKGEENLPEICGDRLEFLELPPSLKKIGAYAFYGCGNLREIRAFSTIADLGAGLFTGCYGIEKLDIRIIPGEKSCLKEMLSELRQTLSVDYRDADGELAARLIFPEFFEESVENTPARILMREMHGCGHMYRNAFVGTEFQFPVYDRLFPYVQVEEKALLVTELALNRLMYPCHLSADAAAVYGRYLEEHGKEVVEAAAREQDGARIRFAAERDWCSERCMEAMLEEASRLGLTQFTAVLMDRRFLQKHPEQGNGEFGAGKKGTGKSGRRNRFVL